MSKTNIEIVRELLQGSTDAEVVNRLVAPDATYVSLNYSNPDLQKVMPWTGTHQDGQAAILKTFTDVNTFWKIEEFDIRDIFESGEQVAVFGSFTLRSQVLNKVVTSPFSIHAKLKNGQVTYMQYMEDTFATGSTFRSGGQWIFQSNPNGEVVQV